MPTFSSQPQATENLSARRPLRRTHTPENATNARRVLSQSLELPVPHTECMRGRPLNAGSGRGARRQTPDSIRMSATRRLLHQVVSELGLEGMFVEGDADVEMESDEDKALDGDDSLSDETASLVDRLAAMSVAGVERHETRSDEWCPPIQALPPWCEAILLGMSLPERNAVLLLVWLRVQRVGFTQHR